MIIYQFFRAVIRLTLNLFFRRIEFESNLDVPDNGPVIFVSNHSNSLVDPLLMVIAIRRPITLTAKNVLATNPLLRWLISAFGVITFHRPQDVGKGSDPRQNVRSLKRCREVLSDGGAVCIFPEGISHSDPKLREFQVGPARIALDFVRKEKNPGRLKVVPVGLLYTDKDRFRSDVWLRFGSPIDVEDWLDKNRGANASGLTERLYQAVSELTLNYETRRESAILSWAAEIVATKGQDPLPLGTSEDSVADRFRLLEQLGKGHRSLLNTDPAVVEELTGRVRRHRAELRRLGVAPAEVHLPMHLGRAALFLIRELELVIIGAPLAFFGVINHLVPYWIVKTIARKMSSDKDHWATNVIYPGLLIFPICYSVQLVAAWLLLPVMWAALYTVALPFTGYYALLYGDRMTRTWRRATTFLQFLLRRVEREKLANESLGIVSQIRDLGTRLEVEDTG